MDAMLLFLDENEFSFTVETNLIRVYSINKAR